MRGQPLILERMRPVLAMLAAVLGACVLVAADEGATPWEQPYVGRDATGPHVLGLWKFDRDDGLDETGAAPAGTLQGGRLVTDGKFGGALESFAGFPAADRSHGFVVPNHPRLSPSGAFTIELWIRPNAEFNARDWAVLIDKKYAGHDDYQLSFGPADAQQRRQLTLTLGFGAESQAFLSEPAVYPAGEWVHIAATYNGQGRVRFFRQGIALGGADAAGRAAISAGSLSLSIGDRLGSNFPGFPGLIDEVRLTAGVREFGRLRVAMNWPRRTFVRLEPAPQWSVTVTNLRRDAVANAVLSIAVGTGPAQLIELPLLEAGETHTLAQEFDTGLRPDSYTVTAAAGFRSVSGDGSAGGSAVLGIAPESVETASVVLVPRPLPQRMPVVMWGIGGVREVVTELRRLKELGFTHCFGGEVDHQRIAVADAPVLVTKPEQLPAAVEMLDTALAGDLRILASTWPSYFEPYLDEYVQVGRGGTPLERRSLTPNAPAVMEVFERAGESIALTYAAHPGFAGVCVNSEIRDESEVSFTAWDVAAYRRAFGDGAEVPAWIASKFPPSYTTLPGFPADRVVEDDHPQLAFFRWWWSVGDGWNAADSAVHRGLHGGSPRRDLWTFTDPAVRCPPLWGNGGDVDVLSQWTYTDPDPLRMSLPVDELLAMAGGRQPPARVMKMTQLFWYRSTTAPADSSPRAGESPARWADQDPATSFFSIHPLHLRAAFWTKIARPIEGIMYHGWSALVPTDGSHAYKYTHPQLQSELARLNREIVEPLGPMLRQVPAAGSDIAFLESFTTFAFTSRGTWGYAGGWQSDVYFALQHARLQPEVIYEQHVQRDGLDRYKVLVMADCEVLTRDIVAAIQRFQQAGGVVIGDDRLCPAIQPDIRLKAFRRVNDAAVDKRQLLQLADELRAQLGGRYRRVVDTTSPDVVPHRRRAGSADYVFLVNDAREPGNYVGQYGRVHELGVPTTADVRITSSAAAVYDLVAHEPAPFRREGADLVVPVTLGPCDGGLLMATSQPIAGVEIEGPAEAIVGRQWSGRIRIHDAGRRTIDAVVPVRVDILDSEGRAAEYSGHYGAAGGSLALTLDLAANDQPGVWEVRVRELASGRRASRFVRVLRDSGASAPAGSAR